MNEGYRSLPQAARCYREELGPFGCYAAKRIRGCMLDYIRRYQCQGSVKLRDCIDPCLNPEDQLLRAERHRRLAAALSDLQPRDREILLRAYESDKTDAAIASELNISRSRVSRIHRRALRELKRTLSATA